jgi:hypothetical protein
MPVTSGPIDYTLPGVTFLRLGSSDLSGIDDEIRAWVATFRRAPDYLVIHTRQLAMIEWKANEMLRFPAHTSATHLMGIPFLEVFTNSEDGEEWIIRR